MSTLAGLEEMSCDDLYLGLRARGTSIGLLGKIAAGVNKLKTDFENHPIRDSLIATEGIVSAAVGTLAAYLVFKER